MKSGFPLLLNDNGEIDLSVVVAIFGVASIGGAAAPALGLSLCLTAITLGLYVLRAIPERRRVTQAGLLCALAGLIMGGISLTLLLTTPRDHAGSDALWSLQDWTPLAPRDVPSSSSSRR